VSSAEKYVTAAYLVSRLEREVAELAELARRRKEEAAEREPEREEVAR
jgi:hypothetical protein